MAEFDGAPPHTAIQTETLEYRAEDAENRCRWNNISIIGLVEEAEGKTPTVFVEELLRSLMPVAQLSPYFTMESAHRMPP